MLYHISVVFESINHPPALCHESVFKTRLYRTKYACFIQLCNNDYNQIVYGFLQCLHAYIPATPPLWNLQIEWTSWMCPLATLQPTYPFLQKVTMFLLQLPDINLLTMPCLFEILPPFYYQHFHSASCSFFPSPYFLPNVCKFSEFHYIFSHLSNSSLKIYTYVQIFAFLSVYMYLYQLFFPQHCNFSS